MGVGGSLATENPRFFHKGQKMDYNPYVQQAFRFLVRNVLADTARNGLSGDSYFFISFETDRDDVELPPYVRAKYPKQISIILQHQFENLVAGEDAFRVDLAFGGVPATIKVPYTALTQFADPSADFGLTFTPVRPDSQMPAEKAEVIDLQALRHK